MARRLIAAAGAIIAAMLKLRPSLSTVALALLVCRPAPAEEWQGKVVGVADGDTITVLRDQTPVKIRLEAIDAPEKAQPFGTQAKAFTSERVFDQLVRVKGVTRDKYGRTVGWVYHRRQGAERCLNEELLQAGLAWHYKQYDRNPALARLEEEARAARRGLWVEAKPTPPWEWRHAGRDAGSRGVPPELACQQDADCVLDFSVTRTDPSDPCSCERCGRVRPRAISRAFVPQRVPTRCAPRPCPACLVEPPQPVQPFCHEGRCATRDLRPAAAPGPLRGNVKAKRFHRPGCPGYGCKHCTAIFQTREEAIRAGYQPCGTCKP